MTDQLKALHSAWCESTGQDIKYRAVERLLYEFHQMDFTAEDLRCVVQGMKRHNSKSDSKYKIQLHKVIGDLEVFASLLGEFKARERNRIKPPSPAQQVLTDFRHTTTETVNTEARSVKDVLREIVNEKGQP